MTFLTIFNASLPPHTFSPFTKVQRTQPLDHRTHPLYGWTRLYALWLSLFNEISWKFPLFSLHHRPHTHSQDASPFTEAQQTQPGPLEHRTHPYMDRQDSTALWLSLINEISRKFPLFSPHHCPHTHSWDASPFTEVQRTQPAVCWNTGRTPMWTDKTLQLYGLN